MSTTTSPRTTTRLVEPGLPAIKLLRRTARSFDISSGRWEDLVIYLQDAFLFRQVALGDSAREWCRLRGGMGDTMLLVIYKSGALLCQGSQAKTLAAQLDLFAVGPTLDQAELFDYSGEVLK